MTPKDVPARTRFQRYRGLRSFRTSPWDPYENLPRDYGQIFEFTDFKQIDASVRRLADDDESVVQVFMISEIGVRLYSEMGIVARCSSQCFLKGL